MAKRSKNIVLRLLGPGLVTGAADDDPSGIATYSQAGAHFGYGLLWIVFFTTPFMIAIQLVSAHIGRVTGKGIIANVKQFYPRALVLALLFLLVAANTINIAADLAAMGEALALVIGGGAHQYALIFAVGSVLLQVFIPYRRYAPILKCMTLVLFFYVLTAFTVQIPWTQALLAAIWPKPSLSPDYLLMVVAVVGTTISPYLFFWQASQEVEEMNRGMARRPLNALVHGGKPEMDRIAIDTTAGMIFSNLIAFFIILTTAATLNANGITEIKTAAEAAEALRPIAGSLTFALFSAGIIGTGLLAIPVLAGSTAYGVAEVFGWKATLEAKANEAAGFYAVVAVATLVGFALSLTPIEPFKMLIWSAVLNGIVAVPIMAVMMVVATNKQVMSRFSVRASLAVCGWLTTALMGAAVIALLWSLARA